MNCMSGIAIAAGALVTLVLAIVSLATAVWTEGTFYSHGLWERCGKDSCQKRESVPDYLEAVRAFHILGVLTLVAPLAAGIHLALGKGDKKSAKMIGSFFIISGSFFMLSMTIFTAKTVSSTGISYGYSYFLGWVVCATNYIMSVVSAILARVG